ncbi:MAG: lysostaphin resistance A-like protein [Candidatus Avoscillospira sp.]
MANAKSYSLGPGLSTAEKVAGFCYLPFYVVLLALILQYLSGLLGFHLTMLQINICYFVINCLMVWIIFHNFLLRSFRAIRFWELIQALILGFVLYYAGNFLYSLILGWLDLSVTSYNDQTVLELASESRVAMVICGVILAPMIEETLVRGLLFGVIRRKSRIAAYAVTILFFAAIHVWQYVLLYDWKSVLLAALQYVPAGIALGWTYEKSNTIWAPILLHMVINAISFGIMSIL